MNRRSLIASSAAMIDRQGLPGHRRPDSQRYNGIEYALREAERFVEQAEMELQGFADGPAYGLLMELADFIIKRRSKSTTTAVASRWLNTAMVPYTEHALVSRACQAIQHYLTTDEYPHTCLGRPAFDLTNWWT